MSLTNVLGRALFGALLVLLGLHVIPCDAIGVPPRSNQFFEEVETWIDDQNDIAQTTVIVQKYFGEFMEPGALTSMPDDKLVQLLSGLLLVVDESRGRLYGPELVAVTQELYQRDERLWMEPVTTYGQAQSVYAILIGTRQFDLADALHASVPAQIEPFPYGRIVAGELEGRPAIVVRADQGKGLEVRPVPLQHGFALVGVVHTGCAFSREAMTYVEMHAAEFEPLFPDTVIWVASQGVTPIISYLERWNTEAKLIKVHVAWKDADWPQDVDLRRTPGFYLLKDGAVVDSVIGWPSDDTGQALKQMLRRVAVDHRHPD